MSLCKWCGAMGRSVALLKGLDSMFFMSEPKAAHEAKHFIGSKSSIGDRYGGIPRYLVLHAMYSYRDPYTSFP